MTPLARQCVVCGGRFEANSAQAKACSDSCRKRLSLERHNRYRAKRPQHYRDIQKASYAKHRASRLEKLRNCSDEERAALAKRKRSYRARDVDAAREKDRIRYVQNADRIKEQARNRRCAKRDEYNETQNKYRAKHADKYRARARQRYFETAVAHQMLKKLGLMDKIAQYGVENEAGKTL